jgi:hypothetical protein
MILLIVATAYPYVGLCFAGRSPNHFRYIPYPRRSYPSEYRHERTECCSQLTGSYSGADRPCERGQKTTFEIRRTVPLLGASSLRAGEARALYGPFKHGTSRQDCNGDKKSAQSFCVKKVGGDSGSRARMLGREKSLPVFVGRLPVARFWEKAVREKREEEEGDEPEGRKFPVAHGESSFLVSHAKHSAMAFRRCFCISFFVWNAP